MLGKQQPGLSEGCEGGGDARLSPWLMGAFSLYVSA